MARRAWPDFAESLQADIMPSGGAPLQQELVTTPKQGVDRERAGFYDDGTSKHC
jgi:hypothetical protein